MQKVLFIFKDKPWYFVHIKTKFSKHYKIKHFILSEKKYLSRSQIILKINKIIIRHCIKKVFFDIDYTSYIDQNFVSKIHSENKIAFSFDTEENITKIKKSISVYTHFLTTEPRFTRVFKNKVQCLFFPLETSENLYKKIYLKKKYDILFFGESKGDRVLYLNEINKLKLKKKF